MELRGKVPVLQALTIVASLTSLALSLVVGYDQVESDYWNWVVRRPSAEEYAWSAAPFSHAIKSGVGALPPNATLDNGPKDSSYGMFDRAVAASRRENGIEGS